MAILAAYASSLPKYVELAIQPTLEWESEMNQDTVTNVNGMQNVEPQAIGLKLNQSEPIGLTASLSQGQRTIVGAMLDCETEDAAYTDMQEALNLGLENTSVVDLITKDEVVTTLNFSGDKSVRVAATDDYAITTSEGNSSSYRSMAVINQAELPINEGDEVGVLRIYEGDEAIDEVPLVALDSASAGINWAAVIAVLLVILYIATFLFFYTNIKKRQQRQNAAHRPNKSGGKKVPPARASRPHQNTQQPSQQKRPSQPASGSRLSKGAMKNPSVGSNAGRQGLEQRLKEKQNTDPRNGGRR